MNEYEINDLYDRIDRGAPQFLPYAKFLRDYRDIVNGNSDGWAYWTAGRNAGKPLMQLLGKAVDNIGRHQPANIPVAEWRRAVGSVKRLCTRKHLPCPTLDHTVQRMTRGLNKFEVDVTLLLVGKSESEVRASSKAVLAALSAAGIPVRIRDVRPA